MLPIIESECVTINLEREGGIPDPGEILLVSSDLQARVRLERAAAEAGLGFRAVSPGAGPGGAPDAGILVLDLDELGAGAADWAAGAGGRARVIGFFSHVQKATGEAAAAAGIETYRRGNFWRNTVSVLRGD